MKIYHYDPATGAYAGQGEAAPDPEELRLSREKAGREVEPEKWLVPAYSTLVAPPKARAGQVAVFASGAWALKAVA